MAADQMQKTPHTPGNTVARGRCWFFHRWGPWENESEGCEVQQRRECARCGRIQSRMGAELHKWGPWVLYDIKVPSMITEPSLQHIREEHRTHQRRQCSRCGRYEDEYVRSGPIGVPPSGKA